MITGVDLILEINGYELNFQLASFIWVALAIIMGTIFVITGVKTKKADPMKPQKGLVFIGEWLYSMIEGIVTDNSGKRNLHLVPYIGTIFVMMLISNIIGILGLQPPTTNLGINVTLALISFILVHYHGIKQHGMKHFAGLFEPMKVMFPMNLFGELAFPISLSVRLFANILSGLIIMTMIYSLFGVLNSVVPGLGLIINVIAVPLHGFFDIFVGFLQAYVFMVLTLFFIGSANDTDEVSE